MRKRKLKKPPKSEISEILESMGYPEPAKSFLARAERLAIEAKMKIPMRPSLTGRSKSQASPPHIVGFAAKSNRRDDLTDKEKRALRFDSSVTTAVEYGWIVLPAVIALQRPYRSGMNAINKYPGKDDRSTLTRERFAEEALEKPARITQTLRVLSAITNVGANVAGRMACERNRQSDSRDRHCARFHSVDFRRQCDQRL